jgi:hypothetical protein
MKIDFEFITHLGVFRDAIHLTDDHGLSEQEILLMKQERLDRWIAVVTAPEVDPTLDVITAPEVDPTLDAQEPEHG